MAAARSDDATPPPAIGARIERFLAAEHPATPCLVIDLDVVERQYRALAHALPAAGIYYAVKANPAAEVIARLAALGAGFDLASPGELARCRDLGVAPDRLSFGHTIKKERDIAAARRHGIDLFAFDARGELDKLARVAPGARVFCRLAVPGRGAQWPLTRKFGCDEATAVELLIAARDLGLRPWGLSFHVGSQQTEPAQWASAISRAATVFRVAARAGVALEMLNLGGGLPAQYRDPVPPLERYAETMAAALAHQFGGSVPRVLIEPGRFLVGDAGVLESEVVLIAARPGHDHRRWVYLDAGRFNGLAESFEERIQYRVAVPGRDGAGEPAVLAGPTCDSADVPYQRSVYALPCDLAIGDRVRFLSTGAYTASYASVEFNGFPPIRSHFV